MATPLVRWIDDVGSWLQGHWSQRAEGLKQRGKQIEEAPAPGIGALLVFLVDFWPICVEPVVLSSVGFLLWFLRRPHLLLFWILLILAAAAVGVAVGGASKDPTFSISLGLVSAGFAGLCLLGLRADRARRL